MVAALSPSDVDRRLPIWVALSELFLDTQLEEADLQRIAAVLHRSPFSLIEIETILRDEISPAFSANLLSVAGEWQPWDDDAVREIMTSSLARHARRSLVGRLAHAIRPRRLPAEWPALKALLD